MKRLFFFCALGAWALLAGCTETPSDVPECVLPGSYCPLPDGGAEDGAAPDAGQDAAALDAPWDGGNG